jgi:RNA polymerase primary sigma factor
VSHEAPPDQGTIAAEALRGREADRALARRLERSQPPEWKTGDDGLATLTRSPTEASPELVAAAKDGDRQALSRLVEAHLPRIGALARRYAHDPNVAQLELVQEGVAGLLAALGRYDPGRGTPFWPYARPTVERAMRRLVSELGDAAVLPERALRRLSRLRSAEDELMRERRRSPSRAEILERARLDRGEAEAVLAAARPPRSFQEPITAEDGGVIGSFGDLIDDPRATDAYDRVLDQIEADELRSLLSVLSSRERDVLAARYGLGGEPRSRREVAEQLGLSISRVRDIEVRALVKLRGAAVAAGAAR